MPFQSVPDTAEIATIYTQNNETLQMTFHAKFDGGYSQGDIDALADNVDARVATSFLPIQTVDCDYVRTEARGLNSIDDFFQQNFGAAGPGEIVSEGFPNMVTIAVQRNAGLTGRSSRGRVFWIGLNHLSLEDDENFVTASEGTQIVAAVNAMASTLDQSGWEPVIVSRFTLGAKRETGVTFPWINTLIVDLRVDTQRGRLP
jgi:hypothetical protein